MAALIAVTAAIAACKAPKRALGPVAPAFVPAFEALGHAIEAGEDQVAQDLLGKILEREPEGDTLARAEGYGRILEGRRLSRALELRLIVSPAERKPGRVVLHLEASHDLPGTLGVHSLPPILKMLVTGVDPRGLEQRSARSIGVDRASFFEVEPNRPHRIRLGDYPLNAGTALAVRGTYELEFPASELELGGELFPANDLTVIPATEVRLASFLPTGPVDPAELLRYLKGDSFSTPAMLERAVRVAPERRAEALDLLSKEAGQMSLVQLEQAIPALRWISGNRHLGADVEAWRRWLTTRLTAEDRERLGLDLPVSAVR